MKYICSFLLVLFLIGPGCSDTQQQAGKKRISNTDLLDTGLIREYHLNRYKEMVYPLYHNAGKIPQSIFEYDMKQYENADRIRYFGRGTDVVIAAFKIAEKTGDDDLNTWAVNYADFLVEKFSETEGHFVEYEKCPWLTEETLWYTIPWGTAFHGNDMVSMYRLIKGDLDTEQLFRWQNHLQKTGEWIYENPVVGTYVFNCTMDLCRLIWRIGDELEVEEWKEWGLDKAKELIIRDVDDEGWIHGESKGVSPGYQLLGTDFISHFAWESGDTFLVNTAARIFDLHIRYATPTSFWNGNFGTRNNSMGKIANRFTTIALAAFGNETAGYFLEQYGHPSWSDDLDLWSAALSAGSVRPEYESVVRFEGINSTVVREGIFQAWFTNYEKSLWAKGFSGLWSEASDDALFSTLHSLPTRVEKRKLRLGSTEDWAGFPHIFIPGRVEYHSHRSLDNLQAETDNGIKVSWEESLLSDEGETGGKVFYEYHFHDRTITMNISINDAGQPVFLDFHLMRRTDQYYTLWIGDGLEAVKKNELPFSNSPRDITFRQGDADETGFQLNNTKYIFKLNELPEGSIISAGMLQEEGLHTRNHGGVRLRLEVPRPETESAFSIDFSIL